MRATERRIMRLRRFKILRRRILYLIENIYGAAPSAKLDAGAVIIKVEVNDISLDGAAAILGSGAPVDPISIIGYDVHSGAVGDYAGIHGNGAVTGRGAGGMYMSLSSRGKIVVVWDCGRR